MNGWSWILLHNFLNPFNKQQLALVSPQFLSLAKWPQAHTSRIQPRFTTWLSLGISKPSTSISHLRLLYTSGRVAVRKTQGGADLGLHHPGNLRACTPSAQLQTMSEHDHPAPTQLILYEGQRFVISGHIQSLQLTGLDKSLPLTCQSNQVSTTRGGCTQPTQGAHLKNPA